MAIQEVDPHTVPQLSAQPIDKTLATVLVFPSRPLNLQVARPELLEEDEPLDQSLADYNRRDELFGEKLNMIPTIVGFGGLVGLFETATIQDKKALVAIASVSILGIIGATKRYYSSSVKRIKTES